MSKITKEQISKNNAVLSHEIDRLKSEELRIRTIFSGLLGSYEPDRSYINLRNERNVKILSWEGIAFLIGKLKADADYSSLFEEKQHLEEKLSQAVSEIDRLKPSNKPEDEEKKSY